MDVSKLYFLPGSLRYTQQSEFPYIQLLKTALDSLGVVYPTPVAAIPTLDVVTTAGSVTSNPITVGPLISYPTPLSTTPSLKTNVDGSVEFGSLIGTGVRMVTTDANGKISYTALPVIPDVSGLVPYTGATTNVNLGEYSLSAGQVNLDTTPTQSFGVGNIRWNDSYGTAEIRLKGNNVTLQIGQEQLKRVVNKTSPLIPLLESNYQVVKIIGATGQRMSVALAQANTEIGSTTTLGVVTETINQNQEGFITTSGEVNGINTTGALQGETWVDGDVLYLSPTVAGGLTKIRPTAPDHSVIVGYVEYAHANNGKIFVKVDNGYELGELHDVYTPTPTNNQSIFWNSSTNRYENNTIAGVLGYTPANGNIYTTDGTVSGNRTVTINNFVNFTGSTGTPIRIINNDNAYNSTLSIQNNSTGTTALTAIQFNDRAGAGRASFGYYPDTYWNTNLRQALYFANVYDKIVFTANSGSNGGIGKDIIFQTIGNPATDQMRIFGNTGNVSVNSNIDAGYKLDVVGTIRSTGTKEIRLGSISIIGTDTSTSSINLSNNGQGGAVITHDGNTAPNGYVFGTQSVYAVASALVEMRSTTKGFLPPRMTNTQRLAIATPAVGLIVYCTDAIEGLYIYKSTGWTFII